MSTRPAIAVEKGIPAPWMTAMEGADGEERLVALRVLFSAAAGKKVDVNALCSKSEYEWTPLGWSLSLGLRDVAELLLTLGADPDRRFAGIRARGVRWTPLGYAAADKQRMDLVHLLLAHGASPSKCISVATDAGGEILAAQVPPLKLAIKKRISVYIVDALLSAGADPLVVTTLDLSDQELELLPPSLGACLNLRRLILKGNPLSLVPSHVRNASVDTILTYLNRISRSGKHPWPKVKVMVLGMESVGKTHLLKRLRGLRYDANQSTNGIDVNEFTLGDKDVMWLDSAGQEVFYSTHQLFLSGRCIYLLVFRLDEGKDSLDRLREWFRTVKQFTRLPRNRASQIVIVGTHADLVTSSQELDELWGSVLEEFSSQVVALVPVSCKTGGGFKELEASILKAIDVAELGVQEIPFYYLHVWNWLLKNRSTIPKLSMAELALQLPMLSAAQVTGACSFLTQSGQCLFREDLDLIITDPKWLIDLLKEVVSVYSGVKHGVVTLTGLKHNAWKALSKEDITLYMSLLERFHIVFPTVDGNVVSWVIPCMLPEVAPAFRTPKSAHRRFERIYEMQAMPWGAVGMLIVRLSGHQLVKVKHSWRHGLIFESSDGSEEGIVQLHFNKQTISLTVQVWVLRSSQGPCRLIQIVTEQCLASLQELFLRVHKPFEEFLVCPHCIRLGSNRTRLPIEYCAELVASNQVSFMCGTEQVPVSDLRDDIAFGDVAIMEESAVRNIEAPFAAGEFGVVCMGRQAVSGEPVVVKELNPGKAREWWRLKQQDQQGSVLDGDAAGSSFDPEAFADFQREAALMSKLRHANIVTLHGIMLNPLRLVMEFCHYGDLFACNEKQLIWKGPVSSTIPPLCWRIISDVANGMAFLHGQRPPIAHCDLRSPNIFLVSLSADDPVCAKVADFGLAIAVTARQTKALKSFQWMAPEAQMGANYTHQCDLYSFAMVANEVLSQSVPFSEFHDLQVRDILLKIRSESLRPSIPDYVPKWMQNLIRDMWKADPTKRPSFFECVERLQGKWIRPKSQEDDREMASLFLTRAVLEQIPGSIVAINCAGLEILIALRDGDIIRIGRSDFQEKGTLKMPGNEKIMCTLAIPSFGIFGGGQEGSAYCWTFPLEDRNQHQSTPGVLAPLRAAIAEKKKSGPWSGLWKKGQDESSPHTSGTRTSGTRTSAVLSVEEGGTSPKTRNRVAPHQTSGNTSTSASTTSASDNVAPRSPSNQGLPRFFKSASPSAPEGRRPKAVTCLARLEGPFLFQGFASGVMQIVSAADNSVGRITGSDPVTCACSVPSDLIWVGLASGSILQISYIRGELQSTQVAEQAFSRDFVSFLAYVDAKREVWACSSRGELAIFDASTRTLRQTIALGVRPHSIGVVDWQGVSTVWIGCRDELRIFSARTRSLLVILPLRVAGDVTCIECVGPEEVWVGVRRHGQSAVWSLSF